MTKTITTLVLKSTYDQKLEPFVYIYIYIYSFFWGGPLV